MTTSETQDRGSLFQATNMEVIVYTKNDCNHCWNAKNLLRIYNIPFTEVNLEESDMLEQFKEANPRVRTMPYIVVKNLDNDVDKVIGGNAELTKLLYRRKDIVKALEKKANEDGPGLLFLAVENNNLTVHRLATFKNLDGTKLEFDPIQLFNDNLQFYTSDWLLESHPFDRVSFSEYNI